MASVENFEDLKIWRDSRVFVNRIYDLSKSIKDYGFNDQIQRASVSVMNNIAEGFERNSDKEFYRFLDIAKSSCVEVRSMIYLATDLGYISRKDSDDLISSAKILSGSIFNLMKYLKK